MPISPTSTVTCPGCAKQFAWKPKYAGKTVRCPCGASIAMPAAVEPDDTELGFLMDDEPQAPPATSHPCKTCGEEYPVEIVICTTCKTFIATGEPVMRSRASGAKVVRGKASAVAEEKSFFLMLAQLFYNPLEAFSAFGFYIRMSKLNMILLGCFYLLGLGLSIAAKLVQMNSLGQAISLIGVIVTPLIGLAIKAGMIDLVARKLTGVSRFFDMLLSVVFLETAVGLLWGVLLVSSLLISWKTIAMIAIALFVWSMAMYVIAFMSVYDVDLFFGVTIGTCLMTIQHWLLVGLAVAGAGAMPDAEDMIDDAVAEAYERYVEIHEFHDGRARISVGRSDYGYMNTSGKLVIPLEFEHADDFSDGLARVAVPASNGEDMVVGFINTSGKLVIKDAGWEYAWGFSDGMSAVMVSDKKIGFIDTTGKMVIEPRKLEDVGRFSEGLCDVTEKYWWGYIDKTGKWAIKADFNHTEPFSEGLARVQRGKQWSYIDKTGKEVFKLAHGMRWSDDFKDGLARVQMLQDGVWGFLDKTGKLVIPATFEGVGSFSEGLALFSKLADGEPRVGFIDRTGKVVVEAKYEYADAFSEGRALVRLDGKFGYIDTSGNLVIPAKYSTARPFSGGLARVMREDEGDWELIDKAGAVAIKDLAKLAEE